MVEERVDRRKKEKYESEELREIKEKFSPKKYEDLFELIHSIQRDQDKMRKKEWNLLNQLREKCMAIGYFPLRLKIIEKFFLNPEEMNMRDWIKSEYKEAAFETLDFCIRAIEDILKKYLKEREDFWKEYKEYKEIEKTSE